MEIKILNTFCCTSECFPLNYCKQHNFQDIIVDLARCYVKPQQSFSYLLLPSQTKIRKANDSILAQFSCNISPQKKIVPDFLPLK